jgi:hypothetical protein
MQNRTHIVDIGCGPADIREQQIPFPRFPLCSSLMRALGRPSKTRKEKFVPAVAMLAVRVPGKRVALIQSASNLLKVFSHLATLAHKSIVRHNLITGCDVFRLPKLSASTAVLWSDIVINHV